MGDLTLCFACFDCKSIVLPPSESVLLRNAAALIHLPSETSRLSIYYWKCCLIPGIQTGGMTKAAFA